MYYEEKIFNGRLHCRTTPQGEWRLATATHASAVNALLGLSPLQRLDAFRFFCLNCGVAKAGGYFNCQCKVNSGDL